MNIEQALFSISRALTQMAGATSIAVVVYTAKSVSDYNLRSEELKLNREVAALNQEDLNDIRALLKKGPSVKNG